MVDAGVRRESEEHWHRAGGINTVSSLKKKESPNMLQSTLSQVRKVGINRGGLYGFFVKGEGLQGTVGQPLITPSVAESSLQTPTSTSAQSTPPTSTNADPPAEKSSKKKRKREEEPSKGGNKKLKKEKAKKEKKETNSEKRQRKRDEVNSIEACEGFDSEQVKRVWERIDREVKAQIKRDELGGRFIHVPADKTARIENPKKPGKTMSWKQARLLKEKDMRIAATSLKKEKVADAMVAGELPNPNGYNKKEAMHHFGKDGKALKQGKLKKKGPEKGEKPETKAVTSEIPVEENETSKAVAAKIAKLSPSEKAQYEERAKAKDQILEEYVLRRLERKLQKKQGRESSSRSETETPLPAPEGASKDKACSATIVSKAKKLKKSSSKKKGSKSLKVAAEVAVTA